MINTEFTYELRCELREILNAVGGIQNCENLRDNLIKANLTEWMIAPPNAKISRVDLKQLQQAIELHNNEYCCDLCEIHTLPKEITCQDCLQKLAAIKNKVKGK